MLPLDDTPAWIIIGFVVCCVLALGVVRVIQEDRNKKNPPPDR